MIFILSLFSLTFLICFRSPTFIKLGINHRNEVPFSFPYASFSFSSFLPFSISFCLLFIYFFCSEQSPCRLNLSPIPEEERERKKEDEREEGENGEEREKEEEGERGEEGKRGEEEGK